MANDLTPFTFENKYVIRSVLLDGEPWFVAKDIASALGYGNTKQAVIDHCKKAQPAGGVANSDPLQINDLDPQTKLIPESDVYRLVMRSQLPAAERFQDWICEVVIPSIRRFGRYELGQPAPVALPGPKELAQMVIAQCERAEAAEAREAAQRIRADDAEAEAARQSSALVITRSEKRVMENKFERLNKSFEIATYNQQGMQLNEVADYLGLNQKKFRDYCISAFYMYQNTEWKVKRDWHEFFRVENYPAQKDEFGYIVYKGFPIYRVTARGLGWLRECTEHGNFKHMKTKSQKSPLGL